MKQQYIDKIKEACIKANPEIMELKFGCQTSEGIFLKQNDGNGYFFTEENLNVVPRNEFKILGVNGRPIQLADVLLAINSFSNYDVSVFADGSIRAVQPRNPDLDKVSHFNLTKPLEDQEEETLKFIAEII